MTHCRSKEHIANLYGVEKEILKKALGKKSRPFLIGIDKRIDELLSKEFIKI
jgi:hypothetical protein